MAGSEERKARALALAEEAASRPEDPTSPGKFSTATVVVAVLGVAGGGIALAVCLIAAPGGQTKLLAALAAAVLGVVAVAGVLKLAGEALGTSPRDRTTPEKALRAYLGSIEQQRWGAAASCLSWVAKRGEEIVRPAVPHLDLEEERFTVAGEKGVADYWRAFTGAFKARGSRQTSHRVRSAEPLAESVAMAALEMTISLDLRTAALGGEARKRKALLSDSNTMSVWCRWPVYERGGLWYVLSAGFPEGTKIKRA